MVISISIHSRTITRVVKRKRTVHCSRSRNTGRSHVRHEGKDADEEGIRLPRGVEDAIVAPSVCREGADDLFVDAAEEVEHDGDHDERDRSPDASECDLCVLIVCMKNFRPGLDEL